MVGVYEVVTLRIGQQLGLVCDELSRVGEPRVERAGARSDVGRDRRPVEPFASVDWSQWSKCVGERVGDVDAVDRARERDGSTAGPTIDRRAPDLAGADAEGGEVSGDMPGECGGVIAPVRKARFGRACVQDAELATALLDRDDAVDADLAAPPLASFWLGVDPEAKRDFSTS
jgi:hypothetical protein